MGNIEMKKNHRISISKLLVSPKRYLLRLLIISLLITCELRSQDFSTIERGEWFSMSGNIGTNMSFSDYGGGRAQQSPWSAVLTAGLNFNVLGVSIPFSFSYGNGSRSFMHPFTRYGLSPRYKDYTLHLGYRSLTLSNAIFSGKTFLGAGAEGRVGAFSFAGFYGQIEEPRAFDTTHRYTPPVYARTALGGRVGMEFQSFALNFTLFKAIDDSTSIAQPIGYKAPFTPKDNLVGGVNARLSLFGFLSLSSEWAISAFTNDMNGNQINNDLARKYSGFIEFRENSSMGVLMNNAVNLVFGSSSINFNQRLISPDYRSLGIPGLATNLRSYSLMYNDSYFNNKVSLNSYFTNQEDNVSKKQMMTSVSNIFGLNSNINLTDQLNTSFSYNGSFISQKLNFDKMPEDQAPINPMRLSNHSFNISPQYNFEIDSINHGVSLPIDVFYSVTSESDTTPDRVSSNFSLSPSYSIDFPKMNFSAGLSYSLAASGNDDMGDTRHSISLNGNKIFLENKALSVNSSLGFSFSSNEYSGSSLYLSTSANYRFLEQHNISLYMNYSIATGGGYNSFRASLSYNWSIPFTKKKQKKSKIKK